MMTSLRHITFYIYIFFHVCCSTASNEDQTTQPYVVYMGRSSSSAGAELVDQSSEHLNLLSSILLREEEEIISIIHSYTYAFNGFSAMLTKGEASILSGYDEVLSVFPDPTLKLHTTRSWEFLDSQSAIRLPVHKHGHPSQDVIIGVIDTGIWPESPSFDDEGMSEIPKRWKGVCMEGQDLTLLTVVVRYFCSPAPKSHSKFTCTKKSVKHQHFISNINYPSISVGRLRRKAQATVKRIVTNVGSPNATYFASVEAPAGLAVSVLPMKMVFCDGLKRNDFRVVFDGKNASRGYNFGAVTWCDGSHSVRVAFAVNVV